MLARLLHTGAAARHLPWWLLRAWLTGLLAGSRWLLGAALGTAGLLLARLLSPRLLPRRLTGGGPGLTRRCALLSRRGALGLTGLPGRRPLLPRRFALLPGRLTLLPRRALRLTGTARLLTSRCAGLPGAHATIGAWSRATQTIIRPGLVWVLARLLLFPDTLTHRRARVGLFTARLTGSAWLLLRPTHARLHLPVTGRPVCCGACPRLRTVQGNQRHWEGKCNGRAHCFPSCTHTNSRLLGGNGRMTIRLHLRL